MSTEVGFTVVKWWKTAHMPIGGWVDKQMVITQ